MRDDGKLGKSEYLCETMADLVSEDIVKTASHSEHKLRSLECLDKHGVLMG